MSRATLRKSRHRPHHSGAGQGIAGPSNLGPRQVAASDYESDAVQYMETREAPPVLIQNRPNRSNTDLNISVLSRYLTGVQSILSIAASATVFRYSPEARGWVECGVNGTLFVVEREPIVTPSGQTLTRVCVFVLNRKALENFVVDLVNVEECELAEEMISFQLRDGEGSPSGGSPGSSSEEAGPSIARNVIGIWIHADEEHTRDINMTIIRGAWQQARLSWNSLVQAAAAEQIAQVEDNNGAMLSQPASTAEPSGGGLLAGRRLSITDLFGQRNGNG